MSNNQLHVEKFRGGKHLSPIRNLKHKLLPPTVHHSTIASIVANTCCGQGKQLLFTQYLANVDRLACKMPFSSIITLNRQQFSEEIELKGIFMKQSVSISQTLCEHKL